MSSGNLVIPANTRPFWWSDELDKSEHIVATYRVTTQCSGEDAAIGMAMEQSASTLTIQGYVEADMLRGWSIRICDVKPVSSSRPSSVVDSYFLNTEVYSANDAPLGCFDITLAIPSCLLKGKPAQLLNVLVGELPRLGFLTSFRLKDVTLPAAFGPGPAFGRQGILKLLGKTKGPLLCRAMRPGVGLDLDTMACLNRDVLVGGFHLVKDDELLCFKDTHQFKAHLQAMISARDEAMQITGEPKMYLANLFCEPDELQQRWDLVCELGADGVLVAPFIQGLGVLPWIARQRKIPVIAHNSFEDMLTRNGAWGIDDAVICHWLRHLGADWFVTPGTFASRAMNAESAKKLIAAAIGEDNDLRSMMPNIQGGKHPGGLADYHQAVGNEDYMLIVANWVDSHPKGMMFAAREFRAAIDALN